MARILVVDDEPAQLRLVGTLLREAGHSVQDAANGAEALALLSTEPYDLLVTDMHMPVMGGLELIEECRRLHPALPIVAMSGGGSSGDISPLPEAGLLGALETVLKPYRPEDLLGAVQRSLATAG